MSNSSSVSTIVHSEKFIERLPDIMESLIRIMMRYGVTYNDAASIMKVAYISVAEDEIGGEEASASRVAIRTGLSRKRISAFKNQKSEVFSKKIDGISRILSLWKNGPDYVSENGLPRILPKKGYKTKGFDDLVKECRLDTPSATALDYLLSLKVVKVVDDSVELLSVAFISDRSAEDQVDIIAENLSNHLDAIWHNLDCDAESRCFERALRLSDLSEGQVDAFEAIAKEMCMNTLHEILNHTNKNEDCESDVSQERRLHVGIYIKKN